MRGREPPRAVDEDANAEALGLVAQDAGQPAALDVDRLLAAADHAHVGVGRPANPGGVERPVGDLVHAASVPAGRLVVPPARAGLGPAPLLWRHDARPGAAPRRLHHARGPGRERQDRPREAAPGRRGGDRTTRCSSSASPGGTPVGERVRAILMDRDESSVLLDPAGRRAPLHGRPGPARGVGDPAGAGARRRSCSPTATSIRRLPTRGTAAASGWRSCCPSGTSRPAACGPT